MKPSREPLAAGFQKVRAPDTPGAAPGPGKGADASPGPRWGWGEGRWEGVQNCLLEPDWPPSVPAFPTGAAHPGGTGHPWHARTAEGEGSPRCRSERKGPRGSYPPGSKTRHRPPAARPGAAAVSAAWGWGGEGSGRASLTPPSPQSALSPHLCPVRKEEGAGEVAGDAAENEDNGDAVPASQLLQVTQDGHLEDHRHEAVDHAGRGHTGIGFRPWPPARHLGGTGAWQVVPWLRGPSSMGAWGVGSEGPLTQRGGT